MVEIFQWQSDTPIIGDGVITGCDENQEWMLKWWWEHYIKCNSHPVTFLDFGMSKSALNWCKTKGAVISASEPLPFIAAKENIPKLKWKMWERVYPGNIWNIRKACFAKTFAFLKTPYLRTLWIDLDAKVIQSISPLFDFVENLNGFALAKAHLGYSQSSKIVGLYQKEDIVYNVGVLCYKYHSPVINSWTKNIYTRNQEFFAEEDLLARVLYEEKFIIKELPSIYNYPFFHEKRVETVILHYMGSLGKQEIVKELPLDYRSILTKGKGAGL